MNGSVQSRPPADFNAAACPILARHFFAVGPLVPIGQVLPAVFANLTRTMADEQADDSVLRQSGTHTR